MDKQFKYLESILAHWEKSVFTYIPDIFLSIIVMIVFFFLAKIFKQLILKFYSKTSDNYVVVVNIIATIVYIFFILSGVFLALQILGLEKVLTKLLAGAGIIGIIAGFAFKDVASNLFAGLLLKIQQPFSQNDWVELDSSYGKVLEIGWITTTIWTVSGQQVFVPNQLIYNSTFTSYSAFSKRRIILKSGVSYGDDLAHVKAVALEEAYKVDSALKDEPIDFYFTAIGDSTYNFELRFWINFKDNIDYRQATSDIIMRIKSRFEQENISIAYSVTTLDFGVKGGVNLFDQDLQVQLNERKTEDAVQATQPITNNSVKL